MELEILNNYFKSIEYSTDISISTSTVDDEFIYFLSNSNFSKVKIVISEFNSTSYVDFYMYGTNLYASHDLNELDFKTLSEELSKILNGLDFEKWKKIELREYYLNKIL